MRLSRVHRGCRARRTRDEVERWFLARGLPLVLRRTDRSHRLLERAAPTVVAVVSLGVLTFVGLLLPDTTDTDYEDSAVDGWVIALYAGFVGAVIVVPPLAAWATQLAHLSLQSTGGLLVAVATIVALVLVIPFLQDDWCPVRFLGDALLNVVLVLVMVWLTYLGAGVDPGLGRALGAASGDGGGVARGAGVPLVVLWC